MGSTELFNQELISRMLSSSVQLMRIPLLPSSLLSLPSSRSTTCFSFCLARLGEADSDPWEELLATAPSDELYCIPTCDLLAANPYT
ncbi:Os09g0424850 [Oryza sativa Japonica Group]|uniref:Os09g0424850 protein n=1 Tax=Oryza sativa subsp. japonica TaxID=39947 RepID=A0A0P0XMC3_ORYSJ|nr:hypothetical protein EE612_047931 [Oryza sativa]BAT08161.1 Os09g0424850 [Oryza sativa Japonica Group]